MLLRYPERLRIVISSTNLEISYASKKAVEVLEKLGGKIKLTKK